MTQLPPGYDANAIRRFIANWQGAGDEIRTAQRCFSDLCAVLGVSEPPKGKSDPTYQFEKPVEIPAGEKVEKKRADVYRRGTFVWENKGLPTPKNGRRWVEEMRKAYDQGKRYAKFLAGSEPNGLRPPILIVFDIGHAIWMWTTFASDGRGDYGTFEDRIEMQFADLDRPDVFAQLRLALTTPELLNPRREAGRITLGIAKELGQLASRLEQKPELVGEVARDSINETIARFMMACVFTLFAEDMELLGDSGEKVFTSDLIGRWQQQPEKFVPEVTALWKLMERGGADRQLGKVLHFNGGLFKDVPVLQLTADEIAILGRAAAYDWCEVEPSIFGTLLEQSLRQDERARLGAFFTPREYIERIVRPTVIEPLRTDWQEVNGRAQVLARQAREARDSAQQNKAKDLKAAADDEKRAKDFLRDARYEVEQFLQRLCTVRVLDPACGTGNFLFVALDLIKQLEREVLTALRDLGEQQTHLLRVALVQPEQFYGLEKKAWSKEIAELVLWIGYLQWWRRERGRVDPPEPVLQAAGHIEQRDAVLAWDEEEDVLDEFGKPVFVTRQGKDRKEGSSTKVAGLSLKRYVGARPAEWPDVDFIVSNPPFIGNKRIRELLGDGYADALRAAYDAGERAVPGDVDYVAYWWHKAAERLQNPSRLRRFGLITTNSIRQTQSGAVLRAHLGTGDVALHFACPDHPWTDPSEELGKAAVRISMTVARRTDEPAARAPEYVVDLDAKRDPTVAVKRTKTKKTTKKPEQLGESDGAVSVRLSQARKGRINPDLTVGADVTEAVPLLANQDICFQGMNLVGEGFRLSHDEITALDMADKKPTVLRRYMTGAGLLEAPHDRYVIDFYGLDEKRAQAASPALFDHVVRHVKPQRDKNRRDSRRLKWWIFGEPVGRLRRALAGLDGYIATVETAKHRFFVRLNADVIPDHKLYSIASDDPFILGVLSSRVHCEWALRAGGRNGVGNDPTWTNTTTFFPFPFPDVSQPSRSKIGDLASRIDVHRDRVLREQQSEKVSLTDLNNSVSRLRASGDVPLSDAERLETEKLQSATLLHLHDELDAVVLEAYGWPSDIVTDDLLLRLVDLNAARAIEEAQGTIRWLRPAYQEPLHRERTGVVQTEIASGSERPRASMRPTAVPQWVAGDDRGAIRQQVAAIRSVLALTHKPMTVEQIVATMEKPPRARVAPAVEKHLAALEVVHAVISKHGPHGEELWQLSE